MLVNLLNDVRTRLNYTDAADEGIDSRCCVIHKHCKSNLNVNKVKNRNTECNFSD